MVLLRLTGELTRDHADDLTRLLRACIDAGASVGFLASSTDEALHAYWLHVADDVAAGRAIMVMAVEGQAVVGTVHVQLAGQPNGPHRAEVRKLLVHPEVRRQGLAAELMDAIEAAAEQSGRWLLVLDTETGSDAERTYRRLGWQEVGTVPDYALTTDGRLASTTVFYKDLR